MPVPTLISDLSTTAGSNSPAGGDPPAQGDDHIRALGAFVAQLRDKHNGVDTSPQTIGGDLSVEGDFSAANYGSGVYTPTFSGLQNANTPSALKIYYQRVGEIVNVQGSFTINVISGAAFFARARINVPISTTFALAWDVTGSGGVEFGASVSGLRIVAVASTNLAEINWGTGFSGVHTVSFTLSYRVL
jgi:hypothetical protein